MTSTKKLSTTGLAFALSLSGLAGCASTKAAQTGDSAASAAPADAKEGGEHKCGAGKCGGEAKEGGEHKCGAGKCGGEAKEGGEKKCGGEGAAETK